MTATEVGVLAAWTSSFEGEAGELVLQLEPARRRTRTAIKGGIAMESPHPCSHEVGDYVFWFATPFRKLFSLLKASQLITGPITTT